MTLPENADARKLSGAKTYLVQRTVILHDVQEFIVANARDECEAQECAEALIGSYSSQTQSVPQNVEQIRCEIIDVGESATWCVVEK